MCSRRWDHWAPPSRLVTTAGQGQSQDSSSAGMQGKTKEEGCQACTPGGLWVWKKRAVPGNGQAGRPVRAHPVREREEHSPGFPGGAVVKNLPANAGDASSIPGSQRSLGEGNGNPLQDSCLENPMERGAWLATSIGAQRVRHS